MPLCHWGKFYEELIRTIMAGNWEQDNDVEKAINYWWGMPTGVVDVICSKKLPAGTVRLVNVLKHNYKTGQFHTFTDQMYAEPTRSTLAQRPVLQRSAPRMWCWLRSEERRVGKECRL